MTTRNPRSRRWRRAVLIALVGAIAVVRGATQGYSFFFLAPGYAQHVFGITTSFLPPPPKTAPGYLGGVVVLQNHDVIAAECWTNGTRLHKFNASAPTFVFRQTSLHPETLITVSPKAGGCGIALGVDGFIYSNMNEEGPGFATGSGLAKIDPATGAATKLAAAPAGNALGVAVDPVTNHIVYPGAGCKPAFGPPPCTLWEFDPVTLTATSLITFTSAQQIGYVDGVAFDPTGTFIFLTNRLPNELDVIRRSPGPAALVQKVPMTPSTEPLGLGFHATSPKFVVTNNVNGTMSRFDFAGDDYTVMPSQTLFATDGFRGDLMQAGPDGCLYLTQNNTRFDDGEQDGSKPNSIVQICGGFATPPGIIPDPPPAPSSLCGYVYNDANNNGVDEMADPGIAGATVNLTGSDYLGIPVSATTTTASDGGYCFRNLQRGTYTISETQPPAYLDGIDTQGAPGTGTAGNDTFTGIDLPAGYNGLNNNFGELLPSSLGGYVYVDADNNGTMKTGEAGIANVTITLTGTDDRGASVTMTGGTGIDGAYNFASLRPGTYTTTETQPAGYLDGKDKQGTPGNGIAGNDVFSNIVLNQNVTGLNNNFGEIVAAPAISLVKKTNGTDNKTAPGHFFPTGSPVTWTYIVSNTGNEALSNVAVTDDKLGAITCPFTTLALGDNMTCTATGTAVAGQYTNIGTATAQDVFGAVVTASSTEYYFGASPAIAIVKKTNGTDNDTGTGPVIPVGAAVTWTYLVSNTGNVTLSNIAVSDDKAGAVACPSNLAAGASMTCTKTGTAVAGQYTNIGTVTAKDPTGAIVGASNPDGYFGERAQISLVKKTNGTDNDTGTGPIVAVGSTVTWTYTVSNGGNVFLSNVAVTDDKVGAITCPATTLDVGASMTCTATGTAIGGPYTNIGSVTAQDSFGTVTTATNRDGYLGAMPGISIVKRTNGSDNDSGTGPIVPTGSTVTWSYIVSNTGNVSLSNVVVSDDKAGAVACPSTLAAGASMTCTKTGTAVAGQYTNIGSVTAKDPTGKNVTASNRDAYFGAVPAVSIVKMTNGTDNDAAPGPTVPAGSTVTWTYLVSNTGNVALLNVAVTDDKAGAVSCPFATLAAGGSMTCTKTGTAIAGQYTNTGTVTAKDPTGKTVAASNRDNYFGVTAAISLVKKTNGTDNDTGTGPLVAVGSTVTWTYIVSNAGNTALTNVAVSDDKIGAINCPAAALAVGASMTCTQTGTAVLGPYTNVGTATATDVLGRTVSAQNADHYSGFVPPAADLGISISAPASTTAGGTLQYLLSAVNNGPSTASSVVVAHAIPANTRFASMVTPAGWACSGGAAGALTCTKPAMTVRETAAFQLTVAVNCPFPTPGAVNAAATIGSTTPDLNGANNTAVAATSVINPAPVISGVRVDPPQSWPPNHKMVDVQVDYTVTGACGGAPTSTITITSNEGDASDWQILDKHHVQVRSERDGGNKDGRIYTITIVATDPTGSSSQKSIQVIVPHDQGHGK